MEPKSLRSDPPEISDHYLCFNAMTNEWEEHYLDLFESKCSKNMLEGVVTMSKHYIFLTHWLPISKPPKPELPAELLEEVEKAREILKGHMNG